MNTKTNEMSRREFVAYTGGVAGLLALAGVFARNITRIDPQTVFHGKRRCDVLVIGSGMAGLFAAVKAHDAGAKVIMVSKGRLGASGQTPFAKGIFAYDPNTAPMTTTGVLGSISTGGTTAA